MPTGYRTCTKCNRTKSYSNFRRRGRGNRNRVCKECEAEAKGPTEEEVQTGETDKRRTRGHRRSTP